MGNIDVKIDKAEITVNKRTKLFEDTLSTRVPQFTEESLKFSVQEEDSQDIDNSSEENLSECVEPNSTSDTETSQDVDVLNKEFVTEICRAEELDKAFKVSFSRSRKLNEEFKESLLKFSIQEQEQELPTIKNNVQKHLEHDKLRSRGPEESETQTIIDNAEKHKLHDKLIGQGSDFYQLPYQHKASKDKIAEQNIALPSTTGSAKGYTINVPYSESQIPITEESDNLLSLETLKMIRKRLNIIEDMEQALAERLQKTPDAFYYSDTSDSDESLEDKLISVQQSGKLEIKTQQSNNAALIKSVYDQFKASKQGEEQINKLKSVEEVLQKYIVYGYEAMLPLFDLEVKCGQPDYEKLKTRKLQNIKTADHLLTQYSKFLNVCSKLDQEQVFNKYLTMKTGIIFEQEGIVIHANLNFLNTSPDLFGYHRETNSFPIEIVYSFKKVERSADKLSSNKLKSDKLKVRNFIEDLVFFCNQAVFELSQIEQSYAFIAYKFQDDEKDNEE